MKMIDQYQKWYRDTVLRFRRWQSAQIMASIGSPVYLTLAQWKELEEREMRAARREYLLDQFIDVVALSGFIYLVLRHLGI